MKKINIDKYHFPLKKSGLYYIFLKIRDKNKINEYWMNELYIYEKN